MRTRVAAVIAITWTLHSNLFACVFMQKGQVCLPPTILHNSKIYKNFDWWFVGEIVHQADGASMVGEAWRRPSWLTIDPY